LSSHTTRSARAAVDIRCVTTNRVRPPASIIARLMRSSVTMSTLDVASSSTSSREAPHARASPSRCSSPPDIGAADSGVSYPDGSRDTNSCAYVARAASSGRAPMAAPTVAPTSLGRSNATPTAACSSSCDNDDSGTPSSSTVPDDGSRNRVATSASTDFPAPDRPTITADDPPGTVNVTSVSSESTDTAQNASLPCPRGSVPSPWVTAGTASTAPTRVAPARARASLPNTPVNPPSPAPSIAYCPAANSSPGVTRPSASAHPPVPSTDTSTSGPTTAPCAAVPDSTRQLRIPCSCSSGSDASTRRSSRSIVPAAAMVRSPASDSDSRAAIRPCTVRYAVTTAAVRTVNNRSTTATRPTPARNATASQMSR
jgi:hypothetical protein